jgi:tetratricopeptide (TPR) repeat protein
MLADGALIEQIHGDWAGDVQLNDTLLGSGLPAEAEWHLREAGRSYHQDDVAEAHLREAQIIAPDHVAVLIGLYRFYFYKGRLNDALGIAAICLGNATAMLGLPRDWRDVVVRDAAFDDFSAVLPRFFLFTLKGYAYLYLRLGHIEKGREALMKLIELDPNDKMGGTVLQGVLDRMGRSDDD